jgi:Zn-dependent metalloprotease
MTRHCNCLSCITPPHLLRKLLENKDRDIRQAALNTLLSTQQLRGMRLALGLTATAGSGQGRRTIFDCRNSTNLPAAAVARTEDGAVSPDASVNRAYDGFGATRDFYRDVLGRNSIDDLGLRLNGYVHRGDRYNNAFWDGREMVFGDGDGILFTDFTSSLDVIGHELTHGVTEFTAGLEYHNQSGALNESMSDVFGSLVKQWSIRQSAHEADWLIGAEVFTPAMKGDALRSMKAPGTAYDNSDLGKDPQPDHMSRYVNLPDTDEGDNGGVHINSGIPNKAFYLTSISIGGRAWEAPGHIWYESLKASSPDTQFQEFANITHAKASALYGGNSIEQQAVLSAWREVGIQIAGVPPGKGSAGKPEDSLVALTQKLETLSQQVRVIMKDVNALKDRT